MAAAHALVDLVRLDSGRVLMYAGGSWHEQAAEFAGPSLSPGSPQSAWRPSNRILAELSEDKW